MSHVQDLVRGQREQRKKPNNQINYINQHLGKNQSVFRQSSGIHYGGNYQSLPYPFENPFSSAALPPVYLFSLSFKH